MMEELAFEIIEQILKLAAIAAVGFIISYLRQRLSEHNLHLAQAIVTDGILFAQQVADHLNGEERYQIALTRISQGLSERGIDISGDRINTMIEATLKELKKEYGEAW